MANANVLQVILQAKDEASAAFEKFKADLETIPATQAAVNARHRQLQTEANEFTAKLTDDRIKLAEIEKEKTLRILYDHYKSGLISAEQYSAGVKAINKQAMEATADPSLFDKIKQNWVALSVGVAAAWMAIQKAADWAKLGAAALQAEESFKNVTAAYGVEGDKLLAKMKEVSSGMIDDSELMLRATKSLQQGLDPDQIVSLLEVARSSARVAGIDVAAAFDLIATATANQQVRGLKSLGIVIDQTKAFEDYANKIGVAADALNEQEKSQALADAAIAEGQRQMMAMGDITMNASEKIQQSSAMINELKETIGKGLIVAIQLIGGFLYWLAAGALVAGSAFYKLGAGILFSVGRFGEAKQMNEDANTMFEAAGETAAKGVKIWDGISLSTKDVAEATKGLAKRQKEAADAASAAAAKQKQASEMAVVISQQELKTLEANIAYENALMKEKYDHGMISLQEYIKFVQDNQKKHVEALLLLKQLELDALNADPKISGSDRAKKTAEIEGEILRIKIQAKADQLKVEDELTQQQSVIQKKGFDDWKNLQDLELQTFKAKLDLENVYDEGAVQAGLLRQTEYLERKLERAKAYAEKEISQAEEAAQRILDASIGTEFNKEEQKAYDDAIAHKEQLQLGLEKTIIESEQNITQAKIKAATDAVNFYKACIEETSKLSEQEAADKIATLDAALKAGVLSYDKYREGVAAIEARITDTFKEGLQERSEQLNKWVEMVQNRIQRTQEIINSFTQDTFDDVKAYWGDYGKVMSESTDQVIWEIKHMTQSLNGASYEVFWNATIFGKRMVQMVGTNVYEWMGKVRDYINYVKGLMASLQSTIDSYRLQLMQLRGDRMGELNAWMKEETQKLEDQYKDELGKTAEYYEAKALLDELYKEKKEKLLEEMKQNEEEMSNSSSAAAAGGGGLSLSVPAAVKDYFSGLVPDWSSMVPATPSTSSASGGTATQTVQINADFNVSNSDSDYYRRMFEDNIWPMFQRKLELMGIKL